MNRKHKRMRAVPGLVIRPVRRQIRRLISGLMNDLANYQRYLKKKGEKKKRFNLPFRGATRGPRSRQ